MITLLPLDGSAQAESSLAYALEGLRPDDEVILVRVVEKPGGELAALDYLTGVQRSLPNRARVVVGCGRPAEQIVAVAQRENVARLLLGTRQPTGLRARLLASVAERVWRGAPCPVWLVPWRAQPPRRPERVLLPVDGSEAYETALDYVLRWPMSRIS